MKKTILLIAILLSASTAMAQYNSSDVRYGFRAGLNYSNLDGDGAFDDLEARYGFHANFFANIPLGKTFALIPEIGLSALGANENSIALEEERERLSFKTNWLQTGVLARVNIGKRIFIQAGPQVGINVTENDNNDYYNWDYSAIGGIGFKITPTLSADVRYSYGLGNILDRNLGETTEANNRYFQVGVSYSL